MSESNDSVRESGYKWGKKALSDFLENEEFLRKRANEGMVAILFKELSSCEGLRDYRGKAELKNLPVKFYKETHKIENLLDYGKDVAIGQLMVERMKKEFPGDRNLARRSFMLGVKDAIEEYKELMLECPSTISYIDRKLEEIQDGD